MNLSNVQVDSTANNSFQLVWDLIGLDGELASDYEVGFAVSESPVDLFEVLNDPLGDPVRIDCGVSNQYLDNAPTYDFNRFFYFDVSLYLKLSPTVVVDHFVTHIRDRSDGVSLAIANIERLILNNYQGYRTGVIKRKVGGLRCSCWNEFTGTSNSGHCSICNGSTYIVGYYDPIMVKMSFEYGNRISQTSQTQQQTLGTIQARMGNYPMVRPGDIVVNLETAQRFAVTNPVQYTQLPQMRRSKADTSRKPFIVSQILVLKELSADDNEYLITV